ncbi:hypothetical protein GCM10009827_097180 [Dactylosporangium maewongense]|uniref:TIR domain-containing protein n=1 Tax=Dactylosporangium maewongense TaxID=634393 RepID=A0ABN2CQ83_9ACTN
MGANRIFVSHTNKDPEATVLLEQLKRDLVANGFEPVVSDQQMTLGEVWQTKLHKDLDRCEGAVIIISRSALTSDSWVYVEATILMQRRYATDFPVIPVIAGEVSRQELRDSDLDRLRVSSLHMPSRAAKHPARLVARQLRRSLPHRRPLQVLEQKVQHALRLVPVGVLDLMGEALDEDLRGKSEEQKRAAVAERLFATDVARFVRALEMICSQSKAEAAVIIEISFPFAWVDGEAARPLVSRDAATRSFALNSNRRLTAKMYVRRACTGPETYIAAALQPNVESPDAASMHAVRTAVLDALGYWPDDNPAQEAIQATLAAHAEKGEPVVVLLQPPVDPDTLAGIATQFPGLICLIMAGHPPHRELPAQVRVLQPHLDPAVEMGSRAEYRKIMKKAGIDVLDDDLGSRP